MWHLSDVSVCMAQWRNHAETAATKSSLPSEVEVSVCDDESETRGFALNPCVPLNAAVNASSRPVVVLTNPGALVTAEHLEKMLAEIDDDTYVAAACRSEDGRWLCHSTVRGGEHGRGPMPEGSGFHFLAVLTRDLWDKAGGFDEDYREGQAYEDNDFLWRLQRAGAKFKILDDVVINHTRSTTVWPTGGLERNRELFRQKWGK